jgi:hypothetical protein
MARTRFGKEAVGDLGLTNRLAGASPTARTVARVRAFIAANQDGVSTPKPDRAQAEPVHVEQAPARPPAPAFEAEADAGIEAAAAVTRPAFPAPPRRRGRRDRIPLPEGMRPTVEALQSALAETPEDLMAAVRRKHPQLWRRTLALSRAERVTPASALYAALETGLDQREQEAPAHGDA